MNLIHPRDPRSADAADIVYCVLCIIDKQFIYLLLTHHFLNEAAQKVSDIVKISY